VIDARGAVRAILAGVAAMTCCAPAYANAVRLGGGEDLHVSLWRIIAALLIAIVLVVLAALLIRQRAGKLDLATLVGRVRVRPRGIDVVETRRLSPHADACLLRYRGREYLLLVGASHGRVLSCVEAVPDVQVPGADA
jgi:hypothetical protein